MIRVLMLLVIATGMMACGGGSQSDNKKGSGVMSPDVRDNGELEEMSAADEKLGQSLYKQNCGSCHQQGGQGVPNMYPPLKNTTYVEGDKQRLIQVVLYGLEEEIEVNGKKYNQPMPPNKHLSDDKIALILTYVRSHFGNEASAITPEEVAKERE